MGCLARVAGKGRGKTSVLVVPATLAGTSRGQCDSREARQKLWDSRLDWKEVAALSFFLLALSW